MEPRIALLLALVVGSWANPGGCAGELPCIPASLSLPAHFLQRLEDRALIDAVQSVRAAVGVNQTPTPITALPLRHRPGTYVRVVQPALGTAALAYRAAHLKKMIPLRGFRAPILEHADAGWPAQLPATGLSPVGQATARLIEQQLARAGLLATLAQAIETLRPARCLANVPATLDQLMQLGFPSDWLEHFIGPGIPGGQGRATAWVTHVARRLASGSPLERVREELRHARFAFGPSHIQGMMAKDGVLEAAGADGYTASMEMQLPVGRFAVATESGEHQVGLLRMQMGGGYRDGIVPGGGIDVISQLVDALRSADFYISLERDVAASFMALATNSWPLRRRDQLTFGVEPFPVAAWAQDNGKAGTITGAFGRRPRLATLAPRYACMDEGNSTWQPAESYLMDGLSAAGHAVLHSPLLFQGGNLLAVQLPKTGERVLLLGEGEVYRNLALGLTREQVLEAFRIEFGVERCVVVPAASYHLDFDVSLRVCDGELVALVNDNRAAVRHIVELGLAALERHGALSPAAAARARVDLAAGRDAALLAGLTNTLQRQSVGPDTFTAAFAAAFVADATDDAVGNLQTFLLALDLLEADLPATAVSIGEARRGEYVRALRRMEAARRSQFAVLQQLGCRLEPVPSMTDLYRSINYLNGLQHRDGYAMPAFGGFYAPLDRAATAAFRRVLGADARIVTIRSAACQRQHGGVHCAAAMYPLLEPDEPDSPRTTSVRAASPGGRM